MSLKERGALLKGKTIAIQGVGSIIHAWERFVAARGGLDPENDVRIAPMDPPAMIGALQTKAVDGFATSLPYTTEAGAERHGQDVRQRAGRHRARHDPVSLRHHHGAAADL